MSFEAANKNDAVAQDLLDNMGREYARCINAVIDNLDFNREEPIEVVLAGSVFVKGINTRAIEKIRQDVSIKNGKRKIIFNVLRTPPVAGAILWALEQNVFKKPDRDKILTAFE